MWIDIKKAIRALAPKRIKNFLAYQEGDEYALKTYSQEGEDLLLKRIFEHEPPGFYVDVGAHHPFRFSNTKLLYDRGWRGINIEPNPKAKSLFAEHRPNDLFVNMGVSNSKSQLKYYMYSQSALNTFNEQRVQSLSLEPIAIKTIPTDTLSSILEEHLTPDTRIDLLSVDVEGYDLQVLQSLDWKVYSPKWIIVEDLKKEIGQGSIHKYLIGRKYILKSVLWNSRLYFLE